jgi:N6-L-threonylcarbamoyladenine synthase
MAQPMHILAFETSCDETGLALLGGQQVKESPDKGFEFTVIKQALLSQAQLHAQYGGVYPNLAKREHEKNLPVLFEDFKNEQFDAVAVTYGPGLEPALWTGINFAQKIAQEHGVPLLPINHMEGHLISSLVKDGELKNVQLPVLGLLISGGHTEFVVMQDWFSYEVIGQTKDDAVGEAYDKVARMLGLPYPGGPEISKLAESVRTTQKVASQKSSGLLSESSLQDSAGQTFAHQPFAPLPRPMIDTKDCNMSFSGLKTAVLYALRDNGGIHTFTTEEIAAVAREFENAVTDVLVHKTKRALEETGAKTFVIGGGVAANKHIRESLQKMIASEFSDVEMRLPELSITGDNAIMIAEAALARRLSGLDDTAKPDLRAVGKLSLQTNPAK